MNIDEWWPRLAPDVREWLSAHNGEPLTPEIAAAITQAGGTFGSEDEAVTNGPPAPPGLSDDDIDWIEAAANEE